ncbi:MAG TPA: hypothetical protein VFD76_07945 [Gemmatimonadales bacterium]|jgi:hypothetical protein|nr:hypothetical protein [Gemmatimonadales bacterium]
MRRTYRALAILSAAALGCPSPAPLTGNQGLFIGSTGGTSADVLSFTVQPSGAAVNSVITPAIQVQVRDSLGTPDTAFAAAITIAIGLNPTGGNLSGTTSVTPVNGVAQFGDLQIDKSGAGYTLRASAGGASTAQSAAFTITGP